MSAAPMVVVGIGNSLAVWHTREQWDTFMRGVDREAATKAGSTVPLELETEEDKP